jgi:hypothetical protein
MRWLWNTYVAGVDGRYEVGSSSAIAVELGSRRMGSNLDIYVIVR